MIRQTLFMARNGAVKGRPPEGIRGGPLGGPLRGDLAGRAAAIKNDRLVQKTKYSETAWKGGQPTST